MYNTDVCLNVVYCSSPKSGIVRNNKGSFDITSLTVHDNSLCISKILMLGLHTNLLLVIFQ